MYTVTVNDRVYPVRNPLMFVHKLQLSRNASVTWHTDGNCTITDNVTLDRPIDNLSTGNVGIITKGIA